MTNKKEAAGMPLAPRSSLSRRQVLTAGAGLAGATALMSPFPYISKARASENTISFWQFYAPGGDVQAQDDWFTKMVADWNAQNEVQVELVYVPTGDYMNGSKLATAFASGQGPDVFLISQGDFLRYYNGGALLNLSPFIAPEAQADFLEGVIAGRMVDGNIYGVPMELEPMAFFYSVKAFEEAGLNENDVPKTWDDLIEVGRKLTTSDRYGLLLETQPGYYQNFTWYPFMWQGGGAFQNPDGTSAFNSPAVIAALKLWQDTINAGIAPRRVNGEGGDLIANMASGYCAMQNTGVWSIATIEANAPDFPYGVFRLPVVKGGQYASVGGGWSFVGNARGKNTEAAGKFIAWALGSKSADSVKRGVDWNTVVNSNMPTRTSVLNGGGAAFSEGKLGTFARDILPGTRGEPRMPPQVYKIISDAIQQTQLGGADPAATAASASQQLDAFLATYTGAPIM